MTPEQTKVIYDLRDAGYCVVIWAPEEIGEADSGTLEDIVIERGNDFLDYANGVEFQDDTDDGEALASAGRGTDEDYGSAADVL